MTAVDHAELKRLAERAIASLNSGLPVKEIEKAAVAFDMAANPTVVLALLSEIEGLEAERDGLKSAWMAKHQAAAASEREAKKWFEAHQEACEALSEEVELRTQAPDSWRPIETAPKPGIEFQVWWKEQWQPRARFNPETHAFELWGRTDYDTEGWECFSFTDATHWMPEPKAPLRPQTADSGK